jgi:hypothetical protein
MLDQPEYVHAVINHLPLIGLPVAMLTLVIALAAKDRTAVLIGLGLVSLLALSAWPVYHYGEHGYDRVLSMADDAGGKFLSYHKQLAERWIFLYFVTAGVAALGFIMTWRWPKSLVISSIVTLVFAAASLTAGVVIAEAGGAVRHREFRHKPPPPSRPMSLVSYCLDASADVAYRASHRL